MYDKQLAAGVNAGHPTQALAGSFNVMITARPGQGLDELVAMADAEIDRLKKEGPTADEVAKAQTTRESGLVTSLQSATRKADFLNGNNVMHGDPLSYKDEMKRLFAVTPDDVKRVANKYLTANRIRLDVTPGEQAQRPPEVAVDRAGQKDVAVTLPEVKDSFDRNAMPKVEGNPAFTPPPVVRRKLSNGLEVIVAERHGLPILSLDLVVKGGANLVPDGKEGLAELMADLMTEGTESRDALELAGELSKIGAELNASSGRESSSLTLTTLTKHADRALELFTDVLLNPSFPDKELERLRKQKLAALARRADSPTAIASIVFPKLLYGAEHPYGRIDTIDTVTGLSRDDVTKLHGQLFHPNNAALIVVGDTTPEAIVAKLEAALKDWKPGDPLPEAQVGTPEARPRALYLVDKPGSAQSVLAVGQVGVPRNTPDYFPIVVMNTVLGGQFSSRINLNLREEKGYTYGARSGFAFRKGPGPFSADTSVQTAVTKEALSELVRELTEVTRDRPPTDTELANAKDRLIKGFPSRFETTFGLAGQLEDLVLYDLPDDYFTKYQANIEAVTREAAAKAAAERITPEKLLILVVGDRAKIEEGLRSLPFGKEIRILDAEGNPVEESKQAAGGGK
jgi:zinc protease